jgi:hypothetical protein
MQELSIGVVGDRGDVGASRGGGPIGRGGHEATSIFHVEALSRAEGIPACGASLAMTRDNAFYKTYNAAFAPSQANSPRREEHRGENEVGVGLKSRRGCRYGAANLQQGEDSGSSDEGQCSEKVVKGARFLGVRSKIEIAPSGEGENPS